MRIKSIQEKTASIASEIKKAGVHLRPGDRSELAFTRAMFFMAGNTSAGHRHKDHVHNDLHLCGAISQIAAAIGRGADI